MSDLKDPAKIDPKLDAAETIRDILGMLFIQSQRNYDVLIMIAEQLKGNTDALIKLHTEGKVLCPEPAFIFEEDDIK